MIAVPVGYHQSDFTEFPFNSLHAFYEFLERYILCVRHRLSPVQQFTMRPNLLVKTFRRIRLRFALWEHRYGRPMLPIWIVRRLMQKFKRSPQGFEPGVESFAHV